MKRNLRIVALAAIAIYVFFWWRKYRIRIKREAKLQKTKFAPSREKAWI